METLRTIQVVSKIGKILSKIVMICCIVGFCLCIAGILGVAGGEEILKFGGITLKGLIRSTEGLNEGTLYAAMAAGMALCAGESVLAGFAARYFSHELAAGTPFTFEGAKELLRLGILGICIPIASQILADIIYAVIDGFFAGAADLSLEPYSSVSLGVMFLLMSLLCRYGAECEKTEDRMTARRVSWIRTDPHADCEKAPPFHGGAF